MKKESKLNKAEKQLNKKQLAVAKNNTIEKVKEVYKVEDTATAELIHDTLKENPAFKEYTWLKKDLDDIENNLKTLALSAEKEETQLKASMYIHDKIYGKAVQKTELAGKDGQPIKFFFDSAFNSNNDN